MMMMIDEYIIPSIFFIRFSPLNQRPTSAGAKRLNERLFLLLIIAACKVNLDDVIIFFLLNNGDAYGTARIPVCFRSFLHIPPIREAQTGPVIHDLVPMCMYMYVCMLACYHH